MRARLFVTVNSKYYREHQHTRNTYFDKVTYLMTLKLIYLHIDSETFNLIRGLLRAFETSTAELFAKIITLIKAVHYSRKNVQVKCYAVPRMCL